MLSCWLSLTFKAERFPFFSVPVTMPCFEVLIFKFRCFVTAFCSLGMGISNVSPKQWLWLEMYKFNAEFCFFFHALLSYCTFFVQTFCDSFFEPDFYLGM